MNFKEDLTCPCCKMILDVPVSLPCGCLICNGHVTEKLNSINEIKCITCNKIHQIPLEGFIVNKMAKKLIEQEMFLSDDEKLLKKSIQDEFNNLRNNLDTNFKDEFSKCHERFDDIREQLQTRKETLKKRIDEISSQMFQTLKRNEDECLKHLEIKYSHLKERFNKDENYKNILEEFRYPSLDLVKLNRLKSTNESNVGNFMLKSKETNQFLNQLNFKPNDNFNFDDESVGQLELATQKPKVKSIFFFL